jgi:hypothetical protein
VAIATQMKVAPGSCRGSAANWSNGTNVRLYRAIRGSGGKQINHTHDRERAAHVHRCSATRPLITAFWSSRVSESQRARPAACEIVTFAGTQFMERRQSTIERQLTRARLFHRERLRLAHCGRETNFRLGVLSGPSGSLVSFSAWHQADLRRTSTLRSEAVIHVSLCAVPKKAWVSGPAQGEVRR